MKTINFNGHDAFADLQHRIVEYWDDDYNLWRKEPNKKPILIKQSLRSKIKIFLHIKHELINP